MRNASNKILRLGALLSISYDHCCTSESISLFLSVYLPFLPHTLSCSFYFQFTSDPPKMSASRFTWNIITLKETNDWLKWFLVIPWQLHCVIQANMRSLVDCVQPARCLCFHLTKELKKGFIRCAVQFQQWHWHKSPLKHCTVFYHFCLTHCSGMSLAFVTCYGTT